MDRPIPISREALLTLKRHLSGLKQVHLLVEQLLNDQDHKNVLTKQESFDKH